MTPPELKVNRDWGAAGFAVENCRAWLEWAAVQVERCLADDEPACAQMLRSLGEMLEPAPAASGDQRMSEVVIAVQTHDRIMQRLTHVSESLRMLHEHLGDAQGAQSLESWRTLRERQLRAFSMAEERALFCQMVAPEQDGREMAAKPDESVELFASADGPDQS